MYEMVLTDSAAAPGGDGSTSCGLDTVYVYDALPSGANSGYAGPSVESDEEEVEEAAYYTVLGDPTT